jgi:lysozyme
VLPDPSLPWAIPLEAVRLIAEAETLALKAYRCPAGVPTIGWGETHKVRMGDTCTKEQADTWLLEGTTERATEIRAACTVPPSDNELGAFTSLAYNIGVDAFKKSTALRLHNAGNHLGASRAICLWDKAKVDGVLTVLPGLTTRRAREQALYLTPDVAVAQPMPQAVEAESRVATSPIVQGGVVTTAGGGVMVAFESAKSDVGTLGTWAKVVRSFLSDSVGVPPEWVLPGLLMVAGFVVVRWRLKQRAGGWV